MIDIQKDVLAYSFQQPVLVDFWAPWCGPCRALGPVIEQIASEQTAQWKLIKLNTEEQPDIAEFFGIRSIPNVKLFYRGEIVDEFSGALPRQSILDWLKKTLPTPGLLALDALLDKMEEPDTEEVNNLLEQYPESPEIRIVLAQLILWDDPARVVHLLEPIRMGTPYYTKATYLNDIADFVLHNATEEGIDGIQQLLREGKLDIALPVIIETLGKNNKIAEGKLSKAAIGIFNTLGVQHPLTKEYRKHLDMVLWA